MFLPFHCVVDIRDLKYHTSWDWLMPVVEKIESLGYNTLISNFQIQISTNNKENIQKNIVNLFCNKQSPKIENLYEAVITFIKWYNKQDKK